MSEKLIAIVCGSRELKNYRFVKQKLDSLFRNYDKEDIVIVSGCAPGADSLGERYSRSILRKEPKEFLAAWNQFGKAAGPIRNSQMAGFVAREIIKGNRGVCIAFYPDYRESDGTSDMIKKARMQDLEIRIIKYGKEHEITIEY